MKYRKLGRTEFEVSEVSFGAWAIGGEWGSVSDEESLDALRKAIDLGVNFIDTADVYGDGRSERLVGQVCKESGERIYVATKAGRRLDEQTVEGYSRENLTAWVERSLKNLGVEAIDLLQLHCPPTDLYYVPEAFGILDNLVEEGKIRFYGVSVEKVEEGLKAIEYPDVSTVQIIFNMFRQRPAGLFFEQCLIRNVGILARVPLASGLLTGKFGKNTSFPENDHRNYNRDGEAFDRGETFAGVDFETGLKAVNELEDEKPEDMSMVQFALRWILMHDAVTCAIPGAKTPSQAEENFVAGDLPELPVDTMSAVKKIYEDLIKPQVHHRW